MTSRNPDTAGQRSRHSFGTSQAAVDTFEETGTNNAFDVGQAAFMRGWDSAYADATSSSGLRVVALGGGGGGQSLHQIAAAIGTSHRILLYHFGSWEGLLVAICNEINEAVAGS